MDLIIEIGTSEQKKLISKEFSVLSIICAEIEPPLNIKKVIVPADFDSKVNEIQKTASYRSVRKEQLAVAKHLYIDGKSIIVISPELYTEPFDSQIRCFYYSHELMHAHNKRRFPELLKDSEIPSYYFLNLYYLFDEYFADRKAYAITDALFRNKSQRYSNHITACINGFINTLLGDSEHLSFIRDEIASFRKHGDVDFFLSRIGESFNTISMAIVHTHAQLHHGTDSNKKYLTKSKFLNNKALILINFLKSKYEENSIDLFNGLKLIEDFLTNFGIKFECVPEGIYCHVEDI